MVFHWLVLTFSLQAAMLVTALHELVLLGDLQSDFINPHECARKMNRMALPQLVLLALVAVLFLLTGRWVYALVYAGVLFLAHAKQTEFHVDSTEVFRALPAKRRQRFVKLGVCSALLLLNIYALLSHALWGAFVVQRGASADGRLKTGSVRPDHTRT